MSREGCREAKGVRRNSRLLCGGNWEFSKKEKMVTRVNATKKSSKKTPKKYELYLVLAFEGNSREEFGNNA